MCVNRERERLREQQNGMKQRIRGLVSLHEIPFPIASYKGKEAIVHIIQKEEDGCCIHSGRKISHINRGREVLYLKWEEGLIQIVGERHYIDIRR